MLLSLCMSARQLSMRRKTGLFGCELARAGRSCLAQASLPGVGFSMPRVVIDAWPQLTGLGFQPNTSACMSLETIAKRRGRGRGDKAKAKPIANSHRIGERNKSCPSPSAACRPIPSVCASHVRVAGCTCSAAFGVRVRMRHI